MAYLTIRCVCSFGLFGQVIFKKLLQSTGRTFYTMITQGIGVIINIIFDPIMIFSLCGFPRMGVAGAAVAIVIGQIVAAALALYFNLRKTGMPAVGVIVFRLFTRQLLSIFNASEAMAAIGVPALRIISQSFLIAGFCIITLSVYQALGHGIFILIVSVVRQLAVPAPSAFLLAKVGGLGAARWSFPFAELFSASLCAVYMRCICRSEIKPLAEEAVTR